MDRNDSQYCSESLASRRSVAYDWEWSYENENIWTTSAVSLRLVIRPSKLLRKLQKRRLNFAADHVSFRIGICKSSRVDGNS
jgi:hypothetical protein